MKTTSFYTRRSHGTGVCYATVIGFVVWSDPPLLPPTPVLDSEKFLS